MRVKFDNLKFSGKSHMHQGVNADAVYDRLEELSAFGKQLLVTEFDVQGMSQNILVNTIIYHQKIEDNILPIFL